MEECITDQLWSQMSDFIVKCQLFRYPMSSNVVRKGVKDLDIVNLFPKEDPSLLTAKNDTALL